MSRFGEISIILACLLGTTVLGAEVYNGVEPKRSKELQSPDQNVDGRKLASRCKDADCGAADDLRDAGPKKRQAKDPVQKAKVWYPDENFSRETGGTLSKTKKITPKRTRAKKTKSGYELVRVDKIDSIASRLNLVRDILINYGRAYDYRTHTTAELRRILHQLDETEDLVE